MQLARGDAQLRRFRVLPGLLSLLYDLLTMPVAVDGDGYVSVPTGPGLGVDLQPEDELVRKYPFEGSTRYAPTRQALQV